ncbi:hypothetical protein K227x_40490 [Rubripirellula lacrimiformis]|uniref:Uncharacterized protein n=1 Tax=Rubripirellula lacrimiformis TaxID=1930273 RepID=A0A517NF20_9BACT|nr:hypothetical protein [Rubripirellula lacrimiformis]QDT05648.1 hypothetical protein K227x_40490 [Rubripirellula lacrimiformis]
MVSLIPGMRHGHGAGWNPPDSYAFAESVVRDGGPWCRPTKAIRTGDDVVVSFSSSKMLRDAVLVSTTDSGITGSRQWTQTPAMLTRQGDSWHVAVPLPPGTTAWFVNVHSDGLTASCEYEAVR